MTATSLRDLLPMADPDLLEEAAPFHTAIQSVEWQPSVWSDEGEITFEWRNERKHAVVTFDGDGLYGYAMLVDGRFVPGEINTPAPNSIPSDLAAYIATP